MSHVSPRLTASEREQLRRLISEARKKKTGIPHDVLRCGHPDTEENVMRRKDRPNEFRCCICRREAKQRWRERHPGRERELQRAWRRRKRIAAGLPVDVRGTSEVCAKGHRVEGDNAAPAKDRPSGKRCRTCLNDCQRELKRKQREAA